LIFSFFFLYLSFFCLHFARARNIGILAKKGNLC